jgi:hypothetical protein
MNEREKALADAAEALSSWDWSQLLVDHPDAKTVLKELRALEAALALPVPEASNGSATDDIANILAELVDGSGGGCETVEGQTLMATLFRMRGEAATLRAERDRAQAHCNVTADAHAAEVRDNLALKARLEEAGRALRAEERMSQGFDGLAELMRFRVHADSLRRAFLAAQPKPEAPAAKCPTCGETGKVRAWDAGLPAWRPDVPCPTCKPREEKP